MKIKITSTRPTYSGDVHNDSVYKMRAHNDSVYKRRALAFMDEVASIVHDGQSLVTKWAKLLDVWAKYQHLREDLRR